MEVGLLDSRMLIKLLQTISPEEISEESLSYILMCKDNVVKCLMYGNNNTGKSYWPQHKIWKENATQNFKNYTDPISVKKAGIDRLQSCCQNFTASTQVKSLEDQFIRLLDEIYDVYYGYDIQYVKKEFCRILAELGAPDSDIKYIDTINDLDHLSMFLANRAKNKGGSQFLNHNKVSHKVRQNNDSHIVPYSSSHTVVHDNKSIFQSRFVLNQNITLRHLCSILEGSQPNQPCWAEELCKSYGLPDIQIPSALCDCMTLKSFENDSDFLNTFLPRNLLRVFLPEANSSEGIADLMQGTHSDALRRTACEELQRSFSKDGPSYLVDDILKKCKSLNLSENQFFTVYETLFKILGDNGERLLRYQQRCQTPTYPYIGMAMLIVYALLGEKYFYHMIPNETLVEKYFHQIRP